jgi:hypothetical protein
VKPREGGPLADFLTTVRERNPATPSAQMRLALNDVVSRRGPRAVQRHAVRIVRAFSNALDRENDR